MMNVLGSTEKKQKSLSLPALIGILVLYLAILQGVLLYLTAGSDPNYAKFPTIDSMVDALLIPVGLSVLFVAALVSWLGWWKELFVEKNRTPTWTWVFPGLILLTMLVATDYANLGKVPLSMVLTLLVSTLLVGLGEEMMFRGIVLKVMRAGGTRTELKAALWTALIFGGVHMSNLFTEGPAAFLQAVIVSVTAIFFYVMRRASGGLWVPIILHAGWDFSLFSANLGVDPTPYPLVGVAMLTNVILLIIVLVKWRSIWPAEPEKSVEG